MQRQILVLDSRYRANFEDIQGDIYKFKLNSRVKINGSLRLEQFVFQNSQYVFSSKKKSNRFVCDSKTITFQGKFDTIDSFVLRFNETM